MISSSDEEEETIDSGENMSLDRIFQELKDAQTALRDYRTENRDGYEKLAKKISQFRTLTLSVGTPLTHLTCEAGMCITALSF